MLARLLRAWKVWMWERTNRPPDDVIARVLAEKAAREVSSEFYVENPRLSVVIQSFNHARNVPWIESRLRATAMEELIVCEDGSLDGSLEEWIARLTRPNDLLLRSNDLHEIRTYSRAIDLARGEIVCLLQDDDRPPADGSWVTNALALFELYPQMAILGGWCGFNNYFEEEYNAPWLPLGEGRIPTQEPLMGIPFMFVENVNIGPYFIRRSTYRNLGGFDLNFSEPGKPGICFEAEFCYRAWLNDFVVGLTDIDVKVRAAEEEYILPGGTLLWAKADRDRNETLNKARIKALYHESLSSIQSKVRAANRLLRPASITRDSRPREDDDYGSIT